MNADVKQINTAILEDLNNAVDTKPRIQAAWNEYTRRRIYSLEHIPNIYFIDPDKAKELQILMDEIQTYGNIYLDCNGVPASISGEPAVLTQRSVHAHAAGNSLQA